MSDNNQKNDPLNIKSSYNCWSFIWRFWVVYFAIGVIINFTIVKMGLFSSYSAGTTDSIFMLSVAATFIIFSIIVNNGILFLLFGTKLNAPTMLWKKINLTIIITIVTVSIISYGLYSMSESLWLNFRYAKGLIFLLVITISSFFLIRKYK